MDTVEYVIYAYIVIGKLNAELQKQSLFTLVASLDATNFILKNTVKSYKDFYKKGGSYVRFHSNDFMVYPLVMAPH